MKYLLYLIFAILMFEGCYNQENYSPIPKIDFKSVSSVLDTDDLGNIKPVTILQFKILDGDQNFGIKPSDTIGNNDLNNFFIDIYAKIDDSVLLVTNDSVNFDGKIPWVAPVGVNNYYKSTVFYNIDISALFYDSVQFVFYVEDREKNKSNEEKTMWIPRNLTGTLTDNVNTID